MTDDEFQDFVAEMRTLVAEEAYVWEVPSVVQDNLGDGAVRVQGPWRQEDCAVALRTWYQAGLVEF